jgi:hypothetical protein
MRRSRDHVKEVAFIENSLQVSSLVKHASGVDTISANWKVKVDGQKSTKELKL